MCNSSSPVAYGQCLLSEEDTGQPRKCESLCVQKLKSDENPSNLAKKYNQNDKGYSDNYADQYQDHDLEGNATNFSKNAYEWVCELRAAVLLPNNTNYDAARPKVIKLIFILLFYLLHLYSY